MHVLRKIGLLATVLTTLIGGAISMPATAVVRSVSLTSDTPSVSGNGGTTINLTAGVPVAAPGTVSQVITQSFDPAQAQLTGSSGIVAPAGWTLTYSSDGTTFGSAPNTPSGWAAIRAVRATGSVQSGGDDNGLQISSGSGTGTAPASSSFASGGGGDGWDVAFDEQGNVYNTFHHDGAWQSGFSTPGLHCHTRTGATCGPGWPFSLRIGSTTLGPDGIVGQPWYHTNDQAMQWVDVQNNRVWIPTNLNDGTAASGNGFVCVDVSNLSVGPNWCGGDIRSAFVKLSSGSIHCPRDCTLGLAATNSELYAIDGSTGALLCLNPFGTRTGGLPGAPCASQPFTISTLTGATVGNYALFTAQDLVWASAQGKGYCFNPATHSSCAGWNAGPVALNSPEPNMLFEIPASTGVGGSICFTRYDANKGCFSVDGSSDVAQTGNALPAAFLAYLPTAVTTGTQPKYAVTFGTRTYWADGSWSGGGKIHCWDSSLLAGVGAQCANWPISNSAYTTTIDSQNPNCIWTNTDSGDIKQFDAITGGSSCVTPPPRADFSAPVLLPRLACTSGSSVRQWRTFKLTAPAASAYSTATLTVLNSSGQTMAGWIQVPITGANRSVDLSALSVALAGGSPRFRVVLNDMTGTDPIVGEVSAVGDAPQLCVPLETVANCPTAPQRIVGSMPTPSPILITGSGEAQPSSGPAEQFTSDQASVTVSPAAEATCLGTISGTAMMQNTLAPVPDAQVRLLDPLGNVVATTTTDSTGAYSFTRLVQGNGYRVEFGPTSEGSADSATASSVSTSRSVTASSTTSVNGTYGVLRTNALSGLGAHNAAVRLMPAPNDSNNTQSYESFTKAATCIIDPSDSQCKSQVTISGEGVWSVDTTTGELIFTPESGYSGSTTSLAYRVQETSSTWETWNYAQVEIATAPSTTSSLPGAAIASDSNPADSTATNVVPSLPATGGNTAGIKLAWMALLLGSVIVGSTRRRAKSHQ